MKIKYLILVLLIISCKRELDIIEFSDDYNTDGFIFIKQDQPLPLSILAIYPELITHDG